MIYQVLVTVDGIASQLPSKCIGGNQGTTMSKLLTEKVLIRKDVEREDISIACDRTKPFVRRSFGFFSLISMASFVTCCDKSVLGKLLLTISVSFFPI